MKVFYLLLFMLSIALTGNVNAQGVAINSSGADAKVSAIFDLSSTDKGLLIPRMTRDQRDAIPLPANGLIIYQTNFTEGLYNYNGSSWELSGGATRSFGEMYESNTIASQGTTISFTDADTYYPWVSAGTGEVSNVTYTNGGAGVGDRLTVIESGLYQVSVSISFSSGAFFATPFDMSTAVFINGVQSPKLIVYRNISSFNVGSASITGIVNLTASDYLDLRFSSDVGSEEAYIYVCDMNIIKLK